jgi:4-hydroxythreonine-4-phosphate dehydrogenase
LTIPDYAPPIVAVTLGDPAGIGPELVAKLLAKPETAEAATIVLAGDPWLWRDGQKIAGISVKTRQIDSFVEAQKNPSDVPFFLAMDTVQQESVTLGQVGASCGASVLKVLTCCLDAAVDGLIDAICFAPLNKASMKLGGLRFEDELHFFADYLKVENYCCEFNTLGSLWTSRLSSHIPFQQASQHITPERITAAVKLTRQSLQKAGFSAPRIAIAALNPHAGDNGSCGREEVEIIAPTLAALNAEGVHVDGPFPADTIFLKARNGLYDAIVTLYHDQGQIAIKLMGFDRGVSVQGGLPIPITTPAHGTAFDIVGQGKANVDATLAAFQLAACMGAARRTLAA